MYAKIENGAVSKYPYAFADLRSDNPNTSFPLDAMDRADIKSTYGIESVALTSHGSPKGHKRRELDPTLVSGVWTQTWENVLKDPKEVTYEEKTLVTPPEGPGKLPTEVDPVWNGSEWVQTFILEDAPYDRARKALYGLPEDQIEYITENGLDAWQAKVAQIKADHPKP